MCLGLAGRVTTIDTEHPDLATVDIAGVARSVNIGLLEDAERPGAGDWVLVHMGFALQRLSDEEAAQTLTTLDHMAAERRADTAEPPWT